MASQYSINRSNLSRCIYIALTVPALGFVATRLISNLISTAAYSGVSPSPRILKAPEQRPTPLSGSDDEIPYPPDVLPGGRNIDTPWGNTRAYEWGPVTGRKVLFVHGISTPCIALAKIAKILVIEGCRVLLYDLPGRGYSDAPDPAAVHQDIKFFSAQILSVLASSELDWMSGFTMVGYSLGGGIAASFTSYYPDIVNSLVLMGPGGILRPVKMSLSSKVLYSGFLLPDWLVYECIGRKLRAAGTGKPKSITGRVDVTNVVVEELPGEQQRENGEDSISPLFEDRPDVSAATAVAWQLEKHPGFVPSFVSSIRWAPIHDGYARWRLIGKRCEVKREILNPVGRGGLKEGKVLIILGARDNVISAEEVAEDAAITLGRDNGHFVKLSGGHDIPLTHANECAEAMLDFWTRAR